LKSEVSDLKHTRGKVCMVRTIGPDSSGSRFFILLKNAPDLDGYYTIFGEVISGMEVADSISKASTDSHGRPLDRVVIKKVSIVDIPEPEAEAGN